MLSGLLKEHSAKQHVQKQAQEVRRREALAASSELTTALVDHLNVGVAQAYLNQKRLDAEAKQLYQNAAAFSKQSQQWLQLMEGFNTALKELGDVENWARTIQADMQIVSDALELSYKAHREST